MNGSSRSGLALSGVTVLFLGLAAAFVFNLWGRPSPVTVHPLVDTNFLDIATIRQSYADLVKAGDDISGFDCYACHDKKKQLLIKYDAQGKIEMPKEHE